MSIFTQTNLKRPKYSKFDLSHDNKLSCNPGQLVPILVQDCLPGDRFTIKPSALIRFAPLVAPIMHRITAKMDFFFVPNRIMWNDWENFITGGEDGEDVSVFPTVVVGNDNEINNCLKCTPGSLLDYLGYAPYTEDSDITNYQASVLPVYAYWLIYDEYYRDQNLQDKVTPLFNDGDGLRGGNQGFTNEEALELEVPARRAWMHDYFTSALPEPQKGPAATIPIGTEAPLSGNAEVEFDNSGNVDPDLVYVSGLTPTLAPESDAAINANSQFAAGGSNEPRSLDNSSNLRVNLSNVVANLSSATAALITDLRRAFRLQEWLEKNARGGSRYFESNLVHYGVKSPDSRLQRPELIGSVSQPVQISEVLQTSSTDQTSPQGNMSGHAISANTGRNLSYYCVEHGYIIGLMTIRPETAYFQGLKKHLFKFDKFDYGWPEFANIGEQPILNKELVINHADGNDGVFGYIPRYAEYKYKNNEVHGDFIDTLFYWHWARRLPENVRLNSDFIECTPSADIFAVADFNENKLWCHVFFKMYVNRALPYFGNPTI